jgi:hypothetical protein
MFVCACVIIPFGKQKRKSGVFLLLGPEAHQLIVRAYLFLLAQQQPKEKRLDVVDFILGSRPPHARPAFSPYSHTGLCFTSPFGLDMQLRAIHLDSLSCVLSSKQSL